MSIAPVAGQDLQSSYCNTCFKPIHPQAKKCTECDTFQDWRRYMQLGSSVLALLVALISVLAVTAPTFARLLTKSDSNIEIRLLDVTDQVIHLLVLNSGDRAGSVGQVSLSIKSQTDSQPLRTGLGLNPKLIQPGTAQLIAVNFREAHQRLVDEAWWQATERKTPITINIDVFAANFQDPKARTYSFEPSIRSFLLAGTTSWHSCIIRSFYDDKANRPLPEAPMPSRDAVVKMCGPLPALAE